ncbi:hypothetical protein PS623_04713 [Pseudomonas fluorescens]|nr:hypothetical protein PS623_04713 [Pseudomonas fluorescens]
MHRRAFDQGAVGDQVTEVTGALLLHVVDDHALHERAVAGTDVAACCGNQCGGDLPVGAAGAPVAGHAIRFVAQPDGLVAQGLAELGVAGFEGLGVGCIGRVALGVDFLGLVGEQGAGLVGKGVDDLEAGADLLFVEDRLERVGAVAVTGDIAIEPGEGLVDALAGALALGSGVGDEDGAATDAAAGHAAGAVAGTDGNRQAGADLFVVGGDLGAGGNRAAGLHLAVLGLADLAVAAADAEGAGVVLGFVADVAGGQAGGFEAVLAVSHSLVAAGDDRAFEVGVAADADVEAAVAGLDPGLLGDAGEVRVHVGAAEVGAAAADRAHAVAERRDAQADADTHALLVDLEGVGVLQALDVEVAANVCQHLTATDYGAAQVGVTAGDQRGGVACGDLGVGVGQGVAIGVAAVAADAQVEGEAVARAAQRQANADTCAHAFAVAVLRAGVLRVEQVDVAVGGEGGVVAGAHLAALDENVAVAARTGGAQTHVVAGNDGRAGSGVALLHGGALLLLGAQRQADVDPAGSARVLGDRSGGIVDRQRGGGRGQRLHAAVFGLARCLLHLLGGLDRADHRVGDGHGEAGLLEQRLAGALAGLAGFGDGDLLSEDVDVAFRRDHITADLAVLAPGFDHDIAFGAADGAGAGGFTGGEVFDALLLGAHGQGDAAAAEQAALFLRLVVAFAAAFGGRFDVHIALGDQHRLLGRDHVAAAHADIAAGLQVGLLAAQGGAAGLGLADGVAQGGGLARQHAVAALELVRFVGELVLLGGRQVDVAARFGKDHALVAGDRGAAGVEVLAGGDAQVTVGLHGAADFAAAGFVAPVAGIPADRLLRTFADGAEVDVAPGLQLGSAALPGVDHLAALQVEVIAGGDFHAAAITADKQPGDPRQVAAGALLAAAVAAQRAAVDVLPGVDGEAVGGADQAAKVVQVVAGLQGDVVALDAATEVVDVLRGQRDHAAPAEAAAVDQVARQVELELLAGDQRAIAVDVALLHAHVDLRHQHLARFAVGQGDVALDQPDDVAGQLGHLLGAQSNTRHQVPVAGQGHGVVDQGAVLRFVVGKAVEEAPAGELGDLFADQLLLVEAVAKALLRLRRVELQALEHVVRRQPFAVAGKARVGLDQVVTGACGVGLEQAVVGQRQVQAAGAHLVGNALAVVELDLNYGADSVLLANLGVDCTNRSHLLADLEQLATAQLSAAAVDHGVLAVLGGGQVDVLDQRRRAVIGDSAALAVTALALDAVEVGRGAGIGGHPLAVHLGVDHLRGAGLEQATGQNPALVVEYAVAAEGQVAAGQNLPRR